MTAGSLEEVAGLKILTVPGLYGSGPIHWQTKWEQLYGFSRIEQGDWDNPDFSQWKQRLVRSLEAEAFRKELILVAHSLGCHLIVKAFPLIRTLVKGVFLVAPPDLKAGVIKKNLSGFSISEVSKLSTVGCLVYSENDPYASTQYSEKYAEQLGLKGINVGKRGHINTESNLGSWEEGVFLLKQLLRSIHAREFVLV
jgi:uncharacterized protein